MSRFGGLIAGLGIGALLGSMFGGGNGQHGRNPLDGAGGGRDRLLC